MTGKQHRAGIIREIKDFEGFPEDKQMIKDRKMKKKAKHVSSLPSLGYDKASSNKMINIFDIGKVIVFRFRKYRFSKCYWE